MNIEQQLLKENSKQNIQTIVEYIGTDQKLFSELMDAVFSEITKVNQRAAHALIHVIDKNPDLLSNWDKIKMIRHLINEEASPSQKRNFMRIFQFVAIPTEAEGEITEIAFSYLLNPKEAIAVRAFSMQVLHNITKKYPELKLELQQVIENVLSEPNVSSGTKNRGEKILKKLHTFS